MIRINKKATVEARPKGVGEEGAQEVEEAGVGHMLVTCDPERKEEIWTVTRGISCAKGKDVLLVSVRADPFGRWEERCSEKRREGRSFEKVPYSR